MSKTIYSSPQVTTTAASMFEGPQEKREYFKAVRATVKEVVDAITKRIQDEIQSKSKQERI